MKEVGQYFKEHFSHFEPEIPSDLWNKMKNDRTLQKFNRLQALKKVVLYGFTPLATIAIVAGIIIFNSKPEPNQKPVNRVVLNQEIKQPDQPTQPVNPVQNPVNMEKNKESVHHNVQEVSSKQNNIDIVNQNTSLKETNHSYPVVTTNPKTSQPLTLNNPEVNNTQNSSSQQNLNQVTKPEPAKTQEPIDNTINENPKNTSTNPDNDKILFIPKGFTPNNDGHNDQFFVTADWEVEDFEMIIFQRGGGIVFKNKDINLGWDGTFNGSELPQGAYAYMITYKNSLGDSKRVKGTINLIR
jgi:gliding motility-associated-like protein